MVAMLNYLRPDFDHLTRTGSYGGFFLFRTYAPNGWSYIRKSSHGAAACRVKSGSNLWSNGIYYGADGNWQDVIAPCDHHFGCISTKLVRMRK